MFYDMRNALKFKCQCLWVKSHWNTSKLICLPVVYGWFQTAMAELSGCDRDPSGLQSLKYLLFGPLQKNFAGPVCSPVTRDVSWVFCFMSQLLSWNSTVGMGMGGGRGENLSVSEMKLPTSWMEWVLKAIPTYLNFMSTKESNVLFSCTFMFVTNSFLSYFIS